MGIFNIDVSDMQDDSSWSKAILQNQQNPSGLPIHTTNSQDPSPQAAMTTYSVSDVMQGMATYRPKGASMDTFNQQLSAEFEGLRSEKNGRFAFTENTKLSPYDVFVGPGNNPDGVILGDTANGAVDPANTGSTAQPTGPNGPGMLDTGALRIAWAGSLCGKAQLTRIPMPGWPEGPSINAICVEAFTRMGQIMDKYNYKDTDHSGAYYCRAITGGTQPSLHSYGIAYDLNASRNPYSGTFKTDMPQGMIDEILALRTNTGAQVFGWGGNYKGNKDTMHFEIVTTPADIQSGIASNNSPAIKPTNSMLF